MSSSSNSVTLGEVSEKGQYGLNAPARAEGDGVRFIRITDIDEAGDLVHSKRAVVDASAAQIDKYGLHVGDLLIARSGATAGKSYMHKDIGEPAVYAGYLIRFRVDTARVLPEYVAHFFRSQGYWRQINSLTRVAAQPNVNAKEMATLSLELPSLDEQWRIVDILDRAASIERLRAEAHEKLRAFIPALFIKMFGDPVANPMGWEVRPPGDVSTAVQYGTSQKANDSGTGTPVLRMGNVSYTGELSCEDLKYLDLSDADFKKYELLEGDILFNRTNSKELVGKTGLWDGRFPAVAASYFIRLRVDPELVTPTFVWAFMNSHSMKKRLFEMARGAIGQSNINAKELKSIPLPLPPLGQQKRFAEVISATSGISNTADTASATAAALSASLMACLFGDAGGEPPSPSEPQDDRVEEVQ